MKSANCTRNILTSGPMGSGMSAAVLIPPKGAQPPGVELVFLPDMSMSVGVARLRSLGLTLKHEAATTPEVPPLTDRFPGWPGFNEVKNNTAQLEALFGPSPADLRRQAANLRAKRQAVR